MAKSNTPAVSPADVRTWAVEHADAKPTRGRLSKTAVDAYNAAHPDAPYVPGAAVKAASTVTVKVATTDKSGRKRTVKVNATPAEIREAAIAAGHEVKGKGRLSAEVQAAGASALYQARRQG